MVTGTERAAGHFGRSPIVHWRYRFTGGGKRIRTRSPTVVFAVGPTERETISIGAAENPTLSSEARPTVRIRFPPAASQTNSHRLREASTLLLQVKARTGGHLMQE